MRQSVHGEEDDLPRDPCEEWEGSLKGRRGEEPGVLGSDWAVERDEEEQGEEVRVEEPLAVVFAIFSVGAFDVEAHES